MHTFNQIFELIVSHNSYDDKHFNLHTFGDSSFSQDKIVFIIRGLPGSGKTGLTDEIGDRFSRHVMYDAFDVNKFYTDSYGHFQFDIRNAELYSNAILGQYVARLNAFKDDIKSHVVIYDNVLPTLRRLVQVIQAGLDCKYIVKVITLKNIWRYDDGQYANPHRVPTETIRSMARHFYVPPVDWSFEKAVEQINKPLVLIDDSDPSDPKKNGHILTSVLLPHEDDFNDVISGNYRGGQKQKAYIVRYNDGLVCMEYEDDLNADRVRITAQ